MKKETFCGLFATLFVGLATPSHANDKHRGKWHHKDHDRGEHRSYHHEVDRTRNVWMIEGKRPVKRVVYVDSRGKYYRRVSGRTVYVQERIFDSYPTRYYYPDGRQRPGISISF